LNARKEKNISSLLRCNYRIFICSGQEPEIHLLDNAPAIGQLRRMAGFEGIPGRQLAAIARFPAPDAFDVAARRTTVMAKRSRRILARTLIGIGGDDRPATQRDDDRQRILFHQTLDLVAKIVGLPASRSYGQWRTAKGLLIAPALALKEQGPPAMALSVILP
jgi:hypothetical protein